MRSKKVKKTPVGRCTVPPVVVRCEVCGAEITSENPKTDPCDLCERTRCCRCNMGRGTVCADCDSEDDPSDQRYATHGEYPS